MNTKNIIGRKIVKINQEKRMANFELVRFNVTSIVLDNGYTIIPTVIETGDEQGYIVSMIVLNAKGERV